MESHLFQVGLAVLADEIFILHTDLFRLQCFLVPLVKGSHLDELSLLVPDICQLPETCVTFLIELTIELHFFKCLEHPMLYKSFNVVLEHLGS